MRNWTPGPWSWDVEELWLEAADPDEPEDPSIGCIILECGWPEYLPSKPDRDLIAAAPELYSLLDELLGVASEYIQGNRYEELFDNCDRVLAKARGETP